MAKENTKRFIPACVPQTGWSTHTKGYVIYTGRAKKHNIKRGTYLHRYIIERVFGKSLEHDLEVHHMNFNKQDNCPSNLLIVPSCFNPSGALRCPYTGQFLSKLQWEKRFGPNVPTWVTQAEEDE